MMRRSMSAVVGSVMLGLLLSGSATAAPPKKFTGGLEGAITIHRDAPGRLATATLSLKNASKNTVYLLLFEYPKLDGAGSSGFLPQGVQVPIESCSRPYVIEKCMASSDTRASGAPINAYVVLDPDIEIDLPFAFAFNPASTVPMYTFNAKFIYRTVTDPKADQTLTEKEKRAQLRQLIISFPNVSVAQAE